MYKEDCPNCIGDGCFDLHCPYCDDDIPKEIAFTKKDPSVKLLGDILREAQNSLEQENDK